MIPQYEITHNLKNAIAAEIRESNKQLIKRIYMDLRDGQTISSYESMMAKYLHTLDTTDYTGEDSIQCDADNASNLQSSNKILPKNSGKILNKITINGKNLYAEENDGGAVFDENNKKLDMIVTIINEKQLYVETIEGGNMYDSNGKQIGIMKDDNYIFNENQEQ